MDYHVYVSKCPLSKRKHVCMCIHACMNICMWYFCFSLNSLIKINMLLAMSLVFFLNSIHWGYFQISTEGRICTVQHSDKFVFKDKMLTPYQASSRNPFHPQPPFKGTSFGISRAGEYMKKNISIIVSKGKVLPMFLYIARSLYE